MNKLLKGSLAGAVGVALLLGGAGTFASWNSSASLQAGTIQAGTLTVTEPSTAAPGSWYKGVATSGATVDLTTFKAVPGDVLTFVKTMTIVATGTNLSANLTLDPTTIAPTGSADVDLALANILKKNAVLTATGTTLGTVAANGTYPVSTGTSNVTVNVKLTWPSDTTAIDNAAKLGSVNLSGLAVLLTQN
jgi:alternate signal-mediated exported protein